MKMRFEGADGTLCCVSVMDIGQDKLTFSAVGVLDNLLVCGAGFDVEELEIHLVASFCRSFLDGGVEFDTVFVSACLACFLDNGVGIEVICDHDVLVASSLTESETLTKISVKFTDWLLPHVQSIGLDTQEERVQLVRPHLGSREGGFGFG